MLIIGVIASSLLKKITDTFTRADTTTGLGATTSGSLWSAVRGNWFISSNKANSTDAPSSYPIASVDPGKIDQTITATDIGSGPGIAFWITDANTWWGSYQGQVTTYVASSYYPGADASYYPGAGASYYPGSYSPPSYTAGEASYYAAPRYVAGFYSTPKYDAFRGYYYAGQYVPGYYFGGAYLPGSSASYYPGSYSSPSYYPGSSASYYPGASSSYTAASTTYAYTLYLIKSIAGTVSSVASQAFGAVASTALKVVTSGLNIAVSSYTDNGFTTQNGSTITTTATGATPSTKSGIVIAPTTNGQTTTLSSLTIE
jgi:hypothetical protein